MKKMLSLSKFWIFITILSTTILSGCQLFNLLLPQDGPIEINDILPDVPEDVLKDAAELEQDLLSEKPIGHFNLNYLLDYESEYLKAEATFAEKIIIEPKENDDYTKAIYYFNKNFTGKQTAELAGLDQAICWLMFEHQVEYHVHGSFDPKECTITLNIETKPLKTEETGTTCPDYPGNLLDLAQLFITMPDNEVSINIIDGRPIFIDDFSTISVTEFTLPVKGFNCPVKIN